MTTTTPYAVFDPTLDLELRREVDVPPRLVWRAWTEPELLKQWFTPAPWKTTACELDLRPGGKFRTVMEGPNGERHDSTGCVLFVIPEKLMLFTDALGPGYRPTGSAFMSASVEISPTAAGTLYVARAFHKDEEARQQHEEMGFHQGWGTALDQLVALAKRL
ncbi:SRPBCC family protein [Ancylobacter oerskovii]|uniref:SRPBCC family protein n=1 Tax=Ancylobacter oerskovii TaxID=459519 RepID=A0ABW4YYI4_9HYPH|nr:SRPBCC family protein [Ancylobacter oerskovii]MBS7541744.1 SRPBCC family protein [Ancylobacter oerskovii]